MEFGYLLQLIRRISFNEIRDWVDLILGAGAALSRIRSIMRRDGVYEILDYDSTLEMVDSKGKEAVFKRTQKVKFLQDNVIAYQDHAWGDGELFADYACSPGVVADRYQEGNRWNVLISLRETKSRGDIVDFYILRRVKNGFTKNEEWRQTEIQFPVKRLRLSVIFPKERYCHRAVLTEKNRNRSSPLGPEHFTELPDGRQVLTWEARNPRLHESFIIKWWW